MATEQKAVVAKTASEEGRLPTLPEVVDRLGFGLAQIRAGLIGSGVYFADGAELLLISAVTDAVGQEWHLSAGERGLVVTIVFLGIMCGNFSSGPIGDMYGRRQLIIAGFAGIFIFSILSSLAVGFFTIAITRFFVGCSFGIGQPAWNTLGAEVTPSKWRIVMQAISMGAFILGEIYSTILLLVDDPQMHDVHWRWLLRMGAIPSAIFGVASVFLLHQSPMYYACTHQQDKAMEVLESMRHDNGMDGEPIDFKLAMKRSDLPKELRRMSRRSTVMSKKDCFRQIRIVFGPQYRSTTLITMFSCFTLNLVYYGTLYAFPQVLAGAAEGAAIELLIGALWEIPGQALGVFLGMYIPRIANTKLYLVLMLFSLLCFTLGMVSNAAGALVFQTIGYYGIKCFVNIGFIVVYQYAIECYPTEARTTGCAVSVGSGRFAGIITPLLFELIHQKTGGFATFFYILIGSCALNLVLCFLLTIEPFGVALSDDIEEEEEEVKKIASIKAGLQEDAPLIKGEQSPIIVEPFVPRL